MIEPGEVHVWQIRLDGMGVDALVHVLSPEERDRAARFHFERDRHRFQGSHGALRTILGRYTQQAPEALEFTHGPHGKPILKPTQAGLVHFNLSHSGALALCAVSCGREVGVDVERLRPLPDFLAIARRFFTPAEWEFVAALPLDEVPAAFYRIWTRTEAWLKATGQGISGLGKTCPETWSITSLELGPEYAGALAVEGTAAEMTLLSFSRQE